MRKPFILVVDDDPHIASLVTEHLESHGYKVTFCTDAAQAMVQAEGLPVGLFIIDVVMSGFGTGIDAYRSIRGHARLKEAPIIFLTGLKPEEARKVVPLQDPRVRLVHKPTSVGAVLKAIQELTGVSPAAKGQ